MKASPGLVLGSGAALALGVSAVKVHDAGADGAKVRTEREQNRQLDAALPGMPVNHHLLHTDVVSRNANVVEAAGMAATAGISLLAIRDGSKAWNRGLLGLGLVTMATTLSAGIVSALAFQGRDHAIQQDNRESAAWLSARD